MKLRRIFAAIAACAIAATSVISASAADNFKGKVTMDNSANTWWTEIAFDDDEKTKSYALSDLIGDTPVDQIDYILFTADTPFKIGYKGTGSYDQVDEDGKPTGEKGDWCNFPVEAQKEYKISDMSFGEGFTVKFAVSMADAVKFDISWEVVTKNAGGDTGSSSTTSTTGSSSTAPSGGTTNPTTGATAGLALAGLAIAGAAVVASKKSK